MRTLLEQICPSRPDLPCDLCVVPTRLRRRIVVVRHLAFLGTIPHSCSGSPQQTGFEGYLAYWQAEGGVHLESSVMKARYLSVLAQYQQQLQNGQYLTIHTEYFPPLGQSVAVLGIYDEGHSVTVIVVSVPDGPDTTLTTQVPELKDCGWQSYLAHCSAQVKPTAPDKFTDDVLF